MKRYITTYLMTVIIGLFIVYWLPLSNQSEDVSIHQVTSNTEKHESIDALPPALGFSQWLNQSQDLLIDKYGDPNLRLELNSNREIWYYQTEMTGQMVVQIDEQKITSMIDLAPQINSGYFTEHMTIDHLKDELDVQSTVSVSGSNDSEPRVFRLTKQETAHSPLFGFDNDTFAIAWFNPTKELVGVYYLNNDLLYHSNLYEGAPLLIHSYETNDTNVEFDWSLLWNAMINDSRQVDRSENGKSIDFVQTNEWLAQETSSILKAHMTGHADKLLTENEVRQMLDQRFQHTSYQLMLTNQFETFGSWIHFVMKDNNRRQIFLEESALTQSALVQNGSHALWICSMPFNDDGIEGNANEF